MSLLTVSNKPETLELIRFGLWINDKLGSNKTLLIYDIYCQFQETDLKTHIINNNALNKLQLTIINTEYKKLQKEYKKFETEYVNYIVDRLNEFKEYNDDLYFKVEKHLLEQMNAITNIKNKLNISYAKHMVENIETLRKSLISESGKLADLKVYYGHLSNIMFAKRIYEKIYNKMNLTGYDCTVKKDEFKQSANSKKVTISNELDDALPTSFQGQLREEPTEEQTVAEEEQTPQETVSEEAHLQEQPNEEEAANDEEEEEEDILDEVANNDIIEELDL